MLDVILSVVDNFADLLLAIINNDAVTMLTAYTTLIFTICFCLLFYILTVAIKNQKFLISNSKLAMATSCYALGDWLSE